MSDEDAILIVLIDLLDLPAERYGYEMLYHAQARRCVQILVEDRVNGRVLFKVETCQATRVHGLLVLLLV